MSQWAREHPELCAEGVTAYDYYAERADQIRHERKDGVLDAVCKRCDGSGGIDRELLGPVVVSVEQCPDCRGTGRL